MEMDIVRQKHLRKLFGSQKSRMRVYVALAVGAFFLMVCGLVMVGLLFLWYAKDLPRPDKISRVEGLSTVITDRNGEKLYDIFEDENRIPVKWEDIPEYLKDATIAVEDKDFYTHQGLSTAGIARAMVNIFIFHNFQGGSTLTQQLVKTVLLTQERTLPRKIKEAILSIQIERKYSKDEILRMYLNEVPYGGTAVGVEAASQYYFGKSVKELDLVESAILAGFPQSPSRYSPFIGDKDAYVWRTTQVLRRMREDGHISPLLEAEALAKLPHIQFATGDTVLRAPHFVQYVKEQLIEKFGEKTVEGGGLTVTTTLDWKLQDKAQIIVAEEVNKAKNLKVSNGAAVGIDPKTGEILLMVGSKDYNATDSAGLKFNVATQGLRQPGSAIKPITYAAAIKKGYTASTLLLDVDTKYPSGDPTKPEYNPKNYDGKYRGPMQMRYALANSINTIAVKTSALVGTKDVLKTAFDMGLVTLEPTDENQKRFGLSLTLGGGEVHLLELTSAFGVFGAGGMRADPVSILRVVDAKGKELYKHTPVAPRRVIGADVSFIVSSILSDNDARKEVFGLKSYLVVPGQTVAVKTGTTDDKRDNWTIGYTPSIVIGTWVGNNDNSPMHPSLASGVTGAAPIWNRIIKEALTGKKNEPFLRPDNIIEMDIDSYGGGTQYGDSPTRKEFFIRGTEPTSLATIYIKVKVSRKDNNKLANAVELANGDYDTKDFIKFVEQDPVSGDGKNRWQEGIDAWVATQGDSKFHPPTETYQGSDQVAVVIKEPGDLSQINSDTVSVRVEASSLNDISKVELYIDGNKVKERSEKSFTESLSVTSGSHIIKARAVDNKGNVAEREIRIGVNQSYASLTPTLTPTPTP